MGKFIFLFFLIFKGKLSFSYTATVVKCCQATFSSQPGCDWKLCWNRSFSAEQEKLAHKKEMNPTLLFLSYRHPTSIPELNPASPHTQQEVDKNLSRLIYYGPILSQIKTMFNSQLLPISLFADSLIFLFDCFHSLSLKFLSHCFQFIFWYTSLVPHWF